VINRVQEQKLFNSLLCSAAGICETALFALSGLRVNHEQKHIFAHDMKALWMKVSMQVKMERGSTLDQDMATIDNNRREDEGISD
jgi:hypothetical protein